MYTYSSFIWIWFCLFFTQGEIDAHDDNFRACADEGQELLDTDHPAKDEVKEKVRTLSFKTFNTGSDTTSY